MQGDTLAGILCYNAFLSHIEMPVPHIYRKESDAFGEVEIPQDALYGANTARSLMHFKAGDCMDSALIRALITIKKAAALANANLGRLDNDKARMIVEAADVLLNDYDAFADQFPLVVYQTGSGTQTNMNVNEVIANLANKSAGEALGRYHPIHPNDDVNHAQSTNDTFPSAIRLAALEALDGLFAVLDGLIEAIDTKSSAFMPIVKVGRTHLQDATPIRLGQVFGSYSQSLKLARQSLVQARTHLLELPLGGSAVGTGLNTHPDYSHLAISFLSKLTNHPLRAGNAFEGLAFKSAEETLSGALNALAVALNKIANDIRLLASGPRCGIGELILPANEAGSSIMPGKVNPTQTESLTMVCLSVMGMRQSLSMAAMSGQFELNAYMPLIGQTLLGMMRLLTDAMAGFDAHLMRNIRANEARIAHHLDQCLMQVTALNRHIGYEKAAQIAKRAHQEGLSLRAAALDAGISKADFDAWVVPAQMTAPK